MSDEREDKLPKWARAELRRLRNDVAEYERRAAGEDATSRVTVGLSMMPESFRHIRDDLPVTFRLRDDTTLSVQLKDNATCIEVYAPGGFVAVTPRSGNVVAIWAPF